MPNLAQLLFSGISLGCIYALIALGFVLIYKATEVVNFAHGDLMTIGAFTGLALMVIGGLPFWVAVSAAALGTSLVGAALERAVIRSVIGQPQFTMVLLTIGLAYMIRGVVTMIPVIGSDTHALPLPYKNVTWQAGSMVLSAEQLAVISVTAVLCVTLFLMFRYTRIGVAMQAASQNQVAAAYVGIPVQSLNTLVWALAAGIAGLAGLALAPFTFVHSNMGMIGLKAFPAAVIGGFSSLPGAVVGGLSIGIVESFAGYFLPEGFKEIAAYLVVLVVLVLMPNGIFGENTRKRV